MPELVWNEVFLERCDGALQTAISLRKGIRYRLGLSRTTEALSLYYVVLSGFSEQYRSLTPPLNNNKKPFKSVGMIVQRPIYGLHISSTI